MAEHMDAGGLAVSATVVGRCGGSVRGDAEVTVESATRGAIEVRSLVGELYGDSIRATAERALEFFGRPSVSVRIRDAGALPFVLEARLEAALAEHLSIPAPPLPPRRHEIASRERLRRTRLYVPGDSPKLMPNAMLYGADIVVLDLEDAVAPSTKSAARALVRHALAALDWGNTRIAVRINVGPMGLHDVRAVGAGADTILVPKAEEPEELRGVAALLDDIGSAARLLPIVESAKGVLRAYEIASASLRVEAVALGLEDLTADLGAPRTSGGEETAWAAGALVVACRAAGVAPLNSVHSVVDDPEATERYARRSATLGFEGIGCIHPRQVGPTHKGFAPDAAAIEGARRIVSEYKAAIDAGKGVLAVSGGMVDAPVYERALRTLERAGAR